MSGCLGCIGRAVQLVVIAGAVVLMAAAGYLPAVLVAVAVGVVLWFAKGLLFGTDEHL